MKRSGTAWLLFALALSTVSGVVFLARSAFLAPEPAAPKAPRRPARLGLIPRQLVAGKLSVWWDVLPADLEARTDRGSGSNIHPTDYAGPDSCRRCHPHHHESWSVHPHRWMNALATHDTVLGDFAAGVGIDYRGGRAEFFRDRTGFGMTLRRGEVRRTYAITQTIGRRFYQYYVGKQIEGPEPAGHHFYTRDHVLPFGYWLAGKMWVPIVHVGPERPDAERPDPFAPPDSGRHYADYAASCNFCHTTFPLGDLLTRSPERIGQHAPRRMHWSLRDYLSDARASTLAGIDELPDVKRGPILDQRVASWEAPNYAATLGVSCEACHLGSKEHVASEGRTKPTFFPTSPHLAVETDGKAIDKGRSPANVNWACGRCHTGERPAFAAGMSTWNSVEYSDAMRGSCYTKLRCIDCHDPHKPIGPQWTRTPEQDDNTCVKCHAKYRPAEARQAHTHHPAGTTRCMDCHMPRINEGIQDIVRTHMIYSPTRADMIEANHPNACNLCHTNQPIDWTLGHLESWYGWRYEEDRLKAAYPHRGESVATGWMRSRHESVRMVGVDAVCRARDAKALPLVIEALDDPYLLNRQFAAKGLEAWRKVRVDEFGYRFYQSASERRAPLEAIRKRILP